MENTHKFISWLTIELRLPNNQRSNVQEKKICLANVLNFDVAIHSNYNDGRLDFSFKRYLVSSLGNVRWQSGGIRRLHIDGFVEALKNIFSTIQLLNCGSLPVLLDRTLY